ncbi:MAG: hypothetical protein HKO57_10950, partial [Akkermansiaceae bacterium]|nr:hypothetical protein [Akkermansiaceae bacterium]
MKTKLIIVVATAGAISTALLVGTSARADSHKAGEHKDDHKEHAKDAHDHADAHDHDSIPGPNGGKVLHEVDPHVELLVTKDRKIQITILDEDGKAAAPGKQDIFVVCGNRSAPTRMKFEKGET